MREALGGPADLVLSDMAANTVGHPQTDHLRTMGLVEAAVDFAPRQLLVQMVKEEREQFGRILAIYDFAKRPHTVLEWGAFSSRQGGQVGSSR